jgi:DNA modification methylase
MKFHPIANIFPMMSPSEFNELKNDISKNGLIEPIWTFNNEIIDGRNRYKACIEVGVKPRFKKWENINGTSLVDFVISLNLKRRHLNASQKAMSAVDALPYYENEALERKLSTLKKGNGPVRALMPGQENIGRAREIVAKLFGVSARYVQYGKSINERLPELAEQIRQGSLTINQGKAYLRRKEEINAFKRAGKQFKSNHHIKIIQADFTKWCDEYLEDNSIDLILTDPPYGNDYLDLWDYLGKIAKRVLKPSRWLITYCGVKNIPHATNVLSESLKYWWTFCLHLSGATTMKYKIMNAWRPILIYYKPPFKEHKLSKDFITGDGRVKDLHKWQQAEHPIKYIIEQFSNVGDQILDPMAGAGTVLKVSRDLKRKCIAIDRDKECVEIMKGRLKLE